MGKSILDTNYKNLASAIVLQAQKDYINAIIYDDTRTQNECLRFFRGSWFATLCDLDPEFVIKKLTVGTNRFVDNTIEKMNEGFVSKRRIPKYRAFECPICGGDVYLRRGKIGYDAKNHKSIYGLVCKCQSCATTLKREEEK